MQIRRRALEARVANYLRTPAANVVFEEFELPFAVAVVFAAFAAVFGLCCLITIVWAPTGIRVIKSVLQWKHCELKGSDLRKNPDRLCPLISYGIIIGPQGFGLVLGTFDQAVEQEIEFLARKALTLGKLYSEGSTRAGDEEMLAMLRDDKYQRNRRRRVPEPYAERRALYLFDIKIDDLLAGHRGPAGCAMFACVATPGDDGVVKQIPWDIIAAAVED